MPENNIEAAEKLSISLPPKMVRVIGEKVSAGTYGSNSEAIRETLHGWMDRERRLAALVASIACGVADGHVGRVHKIDAVRTDLHSRLGVRRDPA